MEQLNGQDWASWPIQLSAGVLSGVAIGYTVRKLTLVALFCIGLGLVFVYALTQWGVASVDWRAFDGQLQWVARQLQQWTSGLFDDLSVAGAGFAAGVLLSLRLR
ncbi:MAG: FUN14 domain-containing protein [Aphanocapsa lilacina HA4352-LM1]|jgi:uncharacterized membrane protein (Fun14 family)|nr:FUN14 domain-containing protein [Aphanocapsa lilacina HA4352-LM1]